MAAWADARLLFSILFVVCCSTVTLAQMPSDCCLEVSHKQIHKSSVVDYFQQSRTCNIDAIIFQTRTGKKLCFPVNKEWVRELMGHVQALKAFCKQKNYQGKRCTGVKRQ